MEEYKSWYCGKCFKSWSNADEDHKPADEDYCPYCLSADVRELKPDDPKLAYHEARGDI